ncbi:hypothetical protein [Antrihabitans cavernicola]|uniref:Uncharacterized protein n=1 Tax=Antrihabitans cavernicola TaxID=2495913 RepID=A0A5A7S688_9NOCA|nr:hypothetical protein [Spelaeibacter cavernicola]KAA0021014.1 hypothetical protein FOY51_20500 [Spelaeibacter cavernicola]
MTTAGMETTTRQSRVVDIAGTAWPLYKIEALVVGLLVFVVAVVVVQSLQVAVLSSAAIAAVVWLAGLARQATGTE